MTGIVYRVCIARDPSTRWDRYVYCGSSDVAQEICKILEIQVAPRAMTMLKTPEGTFVLGDDQERVQIRVFEWEDLNRLVAFIGAIPKEFVPLARRLLSTRQ